MLKVKLFTNIASHYRSPIWKELLNTDYFYTEFYFSRNKSLGIKEIDFNEKEFKENRSRLNIVKGLWFKEILFWQFRVLSICFFKYFDKAIFLGDAYCLSTWIAATVCRLRRIDVIFWGHGLYDNENWFKKRFRILFFSLADKHLLYERRAKKIMANERFDKDKLYVIFNSLDFNNHKVLREKYKFIEKKNVFYKLPNPDYPIIIFIGRLTSAKRIDVLIEAALKINKKNVKINVVIVGDGIERKYLETIGKEGLDKGWLIFKGACYDEEQNAKYLSAADLCVSPGNVGLTGVYSLTFGTPVATHDDMSNQMPEADAIIEGSNGFFFKKNNSSNLAKKLEGWFSVNKDPNELYKNCINIIDTYYNPNYQLKVFKRILYNLPPKV